MTLSALYREQGYVLLKGILPADLLRAHAQRVAAVYSAFSIYSRADLKVLAGDKTEFNHFLDAINALHHDELGLNLTLNRDLRDSVQEILGPIVIRSSAFSSMWGSEAPPHVDTLVSWRGPWDSVCRTWCALEDIDSSAGPLYLYPESHRSIGATFKEEVLQQTPDLQAVLDELIAGSDDRQVFDTRVKRLGDAARSYLAAQTQDLPVVSFPIDRGDVVVFSLETVHGAAPIANSLKTRMSLVMDWQTPQTETYLISAYWGGAHDYRCAGNQLKMERDLESPKGLYRIPDRSIYDKLMLRPVVTDMRASHIAD